MLKDQNKSSKINSISHGHLTWKWTVPNSEYVEERAELALLRAIQQGLGAWQIPGATEQDTLLAIPALSRTRIQKLISEGLVLQDQRPLNTPKLQVASEILITIPAPIDLVALPEDIPVHIIYDDPHLVIVNKQQGLTVHPSETQPTGTLVNALLHQLQIGTISKLSGIGGHLRPGIVHRLDKETSGSLVITKSDQAHHKLVKIFSDHTLERKYYALTYGAPTENNITIEGNLGRSPADRKKMALNVKDGRHSLSRIEVLERYQVGRLKPFASLVAVTLETGRTHQIRVHLTSISCSILGDRQYGLPTSTQSKFNLLPTSIQAMVQSLRGQALHAKVLGFQHPCENFYLKIDAALPHGFLELLAALRNYRHSF